MKTILTLSILVFSFSSAARANSCESCREMEKLEQSFDSDEVARFLGAFTLDSNRPLAREQAPGLMRLCAKFTPLDPMRQVGELCYSIYKRDKTSSHDDIAEQALKALPANQQQMLRKTFANFEKLNKTGGR